MDIRLTKIVCTIGPSCSSTAQIRSLINGGMNVARFNLSHGTHANHAQLIRKVRKISSRSPTPCGVLLDTKGPEIRTGKRRTPLVVKKGDRVIFYPPSHTAPPKGKSVEVSYDAFHEDAGETDIILLDNGELSFDILSIDPQKGIVTARARENGSIGDCRHINLPGADIENQTMGERDFADIDFAMKEKVDFLALSFVHSAEDITRVRHYLRKHKSSIGLIAKIETRQALSHLAEIIAAADAVMIARGDLGAEIPFEHLPAIQDEIVKHCNNAGKPVIVATHMLESMKEHPIPTRAEMMDVTHAATTFSDATMLSGETASGAHPTKALGAMNRLLLTAEKHLRSSRRPPLLDIREDYDIRAKSAVELAHDIHAQVIIVFTRSGATASQLSRFRPSVPIIACTNDAAVQHKLTLLYGVVPLRIVFSDAETTIHRGMIAAEKGGFVGKGQSVILVSDIPKDITDWSIQQRHL
ncbi:pyruvate kinase [Patescibacteria group bacterium]|nr:pyruvate kinase [Patescibacteria group bacterium]MBU2259347.1 pyruvate kinase [Patescibacteria group bacterium]